MNICIDLDNTVNYLCAKEESVELNHPSLGVTFLLLSDRLWLLVVESQERRSSQPQKQQWPDGSRGGGKQRRG
jgi:hypothetical protein